MIIRPSAFSVGLRKKLYGLLGGCKRPHNLKEHTKYAEFYLLGYNAV
jgi:hypothetical protein